jgi:hypothetical protein
VPNVENRALFEFEDPLSVIGFSARTLRNRLITMGRTLPTFREVLERERNQWQSFRRALRANSRQAFDKLWVAAFQHADAATNNPQVAPLDNILFSMLVDLQKQICELKIRTEKSED